MQTEDRIGFGRSCPQRARVDRVDDRAGLAELHPLPDSRRPAGPAGVDQPDARLVLLHLLGEQLGVLAGMPDQERPAEAAENVACGSVTPISVPATLAV